MLYQLYRQAYGEEGSRWVVLSEAIHPGLSRVLPTNQCTFPFLNPPLKCIGDLARIKNLFLTAVAGLVGFKNP